MEYNSPAISIYILQGLIQLISMTESVNNDCVDNRLGGSSGSPSFFR